MTVGLLRGRVDCLFISHMFPLIIFCEFIGFPFNHDFLHRQLLSLEIAHAGNRAPAAVPFLMGKFCDIYHPPRRCYLPPLPSRTSISGAVIVAREAEREKERGKALVLLRVYQLASLVFEIVS